MSPDLLNEARNLGDSREGYDLLKVLFKLSKDDWYTARVLVVIIQHPNLNTRGQQGALKQLDRYITRFENKYSRSSRNGNNTKKLRGQYHYLLGNFLPGGDYDIYMEWGWDNTYWSGKNTGDACVLFDSGGNPGKANFAMCISVDDDGDWMATRLYSCDADSYSEKCGGPTLLRMDHRDPTVIPDDLPLGPMSSSSTVKVLQLDML